LAGAKAAWYHGSSRRLSGAAEWTPENLASFWDARDSAGVEAQVTWWFGSCWSGERVVFFEPAFVYIACRVYLFAFYGFFFPCRCSLYHWLVQPGPESAPVF
jgi:hypothetical protein